MRPIAHLKTITTHKWLVCKYCFRSGLYWQGLTHDLSKFSPVEFMVGARYFQGDHSPNDEERRQKGYSAAWLHHKGRNRHHLEYWMDYQRGEDGIVRLAGVPMPTKYVVEMFCDRLAASKVYRGEAFTNGDPYAYYVNSKGAKLLHEDSAKQLEELLVLLRDEGEDAVFAHIRHHVLKKGK